MLQNCLRSDSYAFNQSILKLPTITIRNEVRDGEV